MKEFLVHKCKMCRYAAVVDPKTGRSAMIMAKPNTEPFRSYAVHLAADMSQFPDQMLDAGFQVCDECSVVAIVTEDRGLFYYQEVS